MSGTVPVVDHVKRTTIQEISSKSPFNIFNIVAIVVILVIGYFLYKKFNTKYAKGAIKLPVMPMIPKSEPAPVTVVEAVAEPPEVSEEPANGSPE
jgi:hypothetical protein